MNKVTLIGRLVRDPEMKYTPGNGAAVTNFTIAVDKFVKKGEEKQADFINCVAWNKTAELIAQYFTKGKMIAISGRIQTRTYDAKDGTKRYVTEVVADELQFLDNKNSNSESTGQNYNAGNVNTSDEDITPVNDGDIPF